MPADLKEPFKESCCDGGATSDGNSCQPCGCDKGANHLCARHLKEQKDEILREGAEWVNSAMKVEEFERFVRERAVQPLGEKGDPYSFIGLAGETGEVMEWLKKSVYRKDSRFDENHLLLELGDVIHYISRIGQVYGWTLKDIMDANIQKLLARYGK